MKPHKKTTIYDIATFLKITPASVSRALNDHTAISQATKDRVKKTAERLHYKRNQHASNLRTGGSKTIGVIVPQINNSFFSTAIAGIESVANQHHYTVSICQSNEDIEKEKAAIETLINQNVAGIIISLSISTKETSHLKQTTKHQIPVIQFDRADENLKTIKVLNDHENVILEAIQHLHSQGYKRIALIAGPQHVPIFRERNDAYIKGLKACKIKIDKQLIVYNSLAKEAAKDATLKLLQSKNPPDAIFASADLAALGALEAARSLNINVPEQLGICGFSNEPYTEFTTPPLTSVNQFSFEMGKKAAELFFLSKESSKKITMPYYVKPQLIIRESTLKTAVSSNY